MTTGRPERGSRCATTVAVGVALAVGTLLAGCGGDGGVDVGSDPVLQLGRDVYGARCASCHGRRGEGAVGSPLRGGAASRRYPDAPAIARLVATGRAGMPAFAGALTQEQIDAVARYVHEAL